MDGAKGHGDVESVTARDANQGFSRLLARVERGARFVVTKNRRPVARIEPAEEDEAGAAERRAAARARLEALMAGERRSEDGWTYRGSRDALHDRSR